jgi:hypothetical protein
MRSRRIGLLAGVLIGTGLLMSAGGVRAASKWDSLNELITLRNDLRKQLRDRSAADAKIARPLDVTIELDQSWRRGAMTLTLRRQGSRWRIRSVAPLPDSIERGSIDASGLSMAEGKLTGPVVFQVSADSEADTHPAPARSHTITLDMNVRRTEPKLILTLRRFKGRDWVLQYKKDGQKWVFEEELKAPRIFYNDGGPFGRTYSPIKPDEQGRFDARIDLTFKGEHEGRGKTYAEKGQPQITFSGRIIDGRVDTTWLRKAPGGKGMFGSGQDALTGVIRSAAMEGKYVSSGAKGRWMGEAEGVLVPAPRDPVAFLAAADPAANPADLDQATTRAAKAYREIRALAMALDQYPVPVTDTLSRVLVPAPTWTDDADEKDKTTYMARLADYARQAADLNPPAIPAGRVAPADETFGPYFGREVLANTKDGNPVPAVAEKGAQAWQPLVDWQMTGPFSVYDQDAPVRAPEVLAVDGVAYQRTQLFTNAEGTVREVDRPAKWIDAKLADATVVAPEKVAASSGSWRYISWYGRTTIQSPAEQTVWLAVRMEGQGMIWLNGQPVWKSGADFTPFQPAIFRATLRKGANRLLVRCGSNNYTNRHHSRIHWFDGHPERMLGLIEFTSFSVHVCTRGAPNAQTASASSAGEHPSIGERYRLDGSGVYEDGNVPVAWDLQRGLNVAWTVDLPLGTAEPVIHKGKVFAMAEPNVLHCLDLASGDTLWTKAIVSPSGRQAPKGDYAASVSPVVTDDSVYVHVGSGAAARLSLDGEVRWMVDTPGSWNHINMGNPYLIEGQLILQSHLPGGDDGRFGLISLNAENGKVRWTVRGPRRRVVSEHDRSEGLGNGLGVMKLVNGSLEKTVILTGEGAVVDASDGTLLHRSIFHVEAIRTPPYVVGDTVYTAPVLGQEAARLWLDDAGRVGVRTLWHSPPKLGRGQAKTVTEWGPKHWMKGPVIKDGRMYIVKVDSAHVPQHYPVQWTQLDIYSTETGQRLSRMRKLLAQTTDPTIAPVITGRTLFVGDGGAALGGFGGTTTHGQMAVMRVNDAEKAFHMHTATRQGLFGLATMVSTNVTPRSRCAPVIEGDRMVIRGLTKAVCLAVTDEKGEYYQRKQTASTAVRKIVGKKPEVIEAMKIEGRDEPPADASLPVSRARSGANGSGWLVLGPFPKPDANAVLAKIAPDDGRYPDPKETVTMGGTSATWEASTPEDRLKTGEWNALKLVGGKRSGAAYLFTVLKVGRSKRVIYLPNAVVAATWIAGQKVERGQTLDLDLGYYPMLIRVEISRVPAFLKEPRLKLGFSRPRIVFDSPELWEQRVRMMADQLREVLRLLPDTSEARSARMALENVGLEAPERPKTAVKPARTSAVTSDKPTRDPSASKQQAAGPPAEESGSLWLYVAIGAVAAVVVVLVIVLRSKGSKEDDVFQG